MTEFILGYPNLEVQSALNDVLFKSLLSDPTLAEVSVSRLSQALFDNDFGVLEVHFKSLFASIPFDWHRRNEIARYEGYYASVFYSHFAAPGLDIRLEDTTSKGRIDMTVLFEGRVLVFEFKVVELEPQGRAMEQLITRDYAAKYMGQVREVYLIGVEFSREKREIVSFEWQAVN